MQKINKKSFYKVKHFRLSDENYKKLKKLKKGTWNHTFDQLIKKYSNETLQL